MGGIWSWRCQLLVAAVAADAGGSGRGRAAGAGGAGRWRLPSVYATVPIGAVDITPSRFDAVRDPAV